ncbi:MAG: aminoglycoside phosphotransferase [Myxococcales bacterium]|nr:aminoglycoside phosphotransferase [Myxococcales bacterium]|tara:strand:+ start:658 stop:1743 length:1086 start_codon:yes stop_codon:yes gene_type:complete
MSWVDSAVIPGARRIERAWQNLSLGSLPNTAEALPPQASLRRYVRLGRGNESFIAMVLPELEKAEEIGGGQGAGPFLTVQSYLHERGLSVPRVYGFDSDTSIIVLEDLGDWTFERGLFDSQAEELFQPGWNDLQIAYERAVDLLVEMKVATVDSAQHEGPWRDRAFDRTLLTGEWEHFLEYLVAEGCGLHDLAASTALREAGAQLVEQILDMPYVFTHRDYQSRNLMLGARGLVIIDFQDALMGPDVYDLVALLRDSYVSLPPTLVEYLLARYHEGLREGGINPGTLSELTNRFHLVSLHRKAKDAGRFVYIDRVKGNPDFLPHIPASIECVRVALQQGSGLEHLHELLGPVLDRDWSGGR